MSEVSHTERLQREIRELTAPLRTHYEEIDAEIRQLTLQLATLRKTKAQLRQVIRVSDPDFAPWGKNGQVTKKKKSSGQSYGPASEKVATAGEWFRSRAKELNEMEGGDGFYVTALIEQYPNDVPNDVQSSLAKICRTLHEQGILRLSKVGGLGGRKYYKVVV